MKKLMIIAAMLFSASALADQIVPRNAHYTFQSASTWVNAVYNKSLCLNGDTYEATVLSCLAYREAGDGERECDKYGKIEISQPMVSTRQRCAQTDDDGDCESYETVEFVQEPTRTINWVRVDSDSGSEYFVKSETLTVPACN